MQKTQITGDIGPPQQHRTGTHHVYERRRKRQQTRIIRFGIERQQKEEEEEFNVHYKATNTNITIKKKSNHTDRTKRGIIKGYSDRARALCDPEYLEEELNNIKEVFKKNGYTEHEIGDAMKERRRTETTEAETTENETEQPSR